MKKILTICLMLLGVVAQAQNFVISATTEASVRKNVVKGNSANYGFGVINDTLKLIGLTRVINILPTVITKATLGLGNVNNTSDLNKPISTATQTALNLKEDKLPQSYNQQRSYFVEDYGVTGGGMNGEPPTEIRMKAWITATDLKSDLSIYEVDNTRDLDKPISNATQTALNGKLSFTNIAVTNLSDSSTVTHNLNTTKIDVSFFVSNRENNQINWHPDTNNTIKIYLPVRDKTTQKKFTGEVFIAKRQ